MPISTRAWITLGAVHEGYHNSLSVLDSIKADCPSFNRTYVAKKLNPETLVCQKFHRFLQNIKHENIKFLGEFITGN